MVETRAGAYHSGAPERCSTLRLTTGLTHKHYVRLERLARDKHTSKLRKFVNYRGKKFYNVSHRPEFIYER